MSSRIQCLVLAHQIPKVYSPSRDPRSYRIFNIIILFCPTLHFSNLSSILKQTGRRSHPLPSSVLEARSFKRHLLFGGRRKNVDFINQSTHLRDNILWCHSKDPWRSKAQDSRLPLPPSLKFTCHPIGVAWLSAPLRILHPRASQVEKVRAVKPITKGGDSVV